MPMEPPLVTPQDYRLKARQLRIQASSGGVSQVTNDGTTVRFVTPKELMETADKFDEIADRMMQRRGQGLGYSSLRFRRG